VAQDRKAIAREAAQRCIKLLKEKFGVKNAFVFGSLRGDGPWHEGSDIDIGVEGLPRGRYMEALVELYELLPEGMDLDLVPLEHATPEMVAMVKGEVKMPDDDFEALRMEVQNEIKGLERIVEETSSELANLPQEPTRLQVGGMGKYVHDFYEGVERIFERIERGLSIPVPSGESWHILPLRQMEREVEGKRAALLDHSLALKLHRYLRFRHLFRHTYGYELVWEELRPLVEMMPEVLEELRRSIDDLLGRRQNDGCRNLELRRSRPEARR